jgi:hypothetical protein
MGGPALGGPSPPEVAVATLVTVAEVEAGASARSRHDRPRATVSRNSGDRAFTGASTKGRYDNLSFVDLLVTIGLDPALVDSLRQRLEARVVAYPAVPRVYSVDGQVRVESASVTGRWLEPGGVLFYGYFEDAGPARRALALASTPTFPDVGATLPLDERAMALLLALRADGRLSGRGFVPSGVAVTVESEHVLKWGNRHCGEDKARVTGKVDPVGDAVIEPFVAGRSVRMLIVGDKAWQLHYESNDWRKNVGATITVADVDLGLLARTRRTVDRLGLALAGVDYVVTGTDAVLLEVNAYPGLEDLPDASEAFLGMAESWWNGIVKGPR